MPEFENSAFRDFGVKARRESPIHTIKLPATKSTPVGRCSGGAQGRTELTASPAVQPTPDVGAVFAVYPDWDIDNGNELTIQGGTEQACMATCSTSATCVAYAYVPYGGSNTGPGPACVLKSSFNIATFNTQAFDLSVGLLGACGTSTDMSSIPTSHRVQYTGDNSYLSPSFLYGVKPGAWAVHPDITANHEDGHKFRGLDLMEHWRNKIAAVVVGKYSVAAEGYNDGTTELQLWMGNFCN
ncbi:hypothetical protein DFH09DRAFT_1075838 [Mycena vulgaris]|nr:hypothetical protein DFH09DRAFT_1075838 [Mycena vulgaris]